MDPLIAKWSLVDYSERVNEDTKAIATVDTRAIRKI